jgi:hypothetical protein
MVVAVVMRMGTRPGATPAAFGAWLQGVLKERRSRARESAEAEAVMRSHKQLGQLGQLQRVQASLTWWRVAAFVLAGLWAGTMFWLLLGRH